MAYHLLIHSLTRVFQTFYLELSKHAELIFAPYNYILDPGIRKALDINLKGSVVVLDEGHNVEGILTESGSGKWSEIELSHLVAKLAFYASAAKSLSGKVELNGGLDTLDFSEISHSLLLFVEKVVLHMRDLKSKFELSSGKQAQAQLARSFVCFGSCDQSF
jgi:Rad3-related DNA helicase